MNYEYAANYKQAQLYASQFIHYEQIETTAAKSIDFAQDYTYIKTNNDNTNEIQGVGELRSGNFENWTNTVETRRLNTQRNWKKEN